MRVSYFSQNYLSMVVQLFYQSCGFGLRLTGSRTDHEENPVLLVEGPKAKPGPDPMRERRILHIRILLSVQEVVTHFMW